MHVVSQLLLPEAHFLTPLPVSTMGSLFVFMSSLACPDKMKNTLSDIIVPLEMGLPSS